jgi:hypothetical protein
MYRNILVVTFITIALIFTTPLTGQYYTDLGDNSGIDVSSYQATLSFAAQELVESFPAEFQDSFKIFTFGHYVHNGDFNGGYQEIFEQAISEVQAISKYYLLIGRTSSEAGICEDFKISIELPYTSYFSCMNVTQRTMEELRATESVTAELPISKIGDYVHLEVKVMNTLKTTVIKQIECCDSTTQTPCPIYGDVGLIQSQLHNLGFIGQPVDGITIGTSGSGTNVSDFTNMNIDGVSIGQIAQDAVSNFKSLSNKLSHVYITDNFAIWQDTVFDYVNSAYDEDPYDVDIWIHIWQSEDLSESIMYVKADFYLLADDPDLYPGLGNESSALQNKDLLRSSTDTTWLIYDPELDEYFTSSIIMPLQVEPYGPHSLPPHPTHLVSEGETLTSIVSAYGSSFAINDIIAWNPDKLDDANTTLQVGWSLALYNEDYEGLLLNEYGIYGVAMPILPLLESYNPVTLDQAPDQGFNGLLPFKVIEVQSDIPYEDVQEKINRPEKWYDIRKYTDGNGFVKLSLRRASGIIGLILVPAPVGNFSPMMAWDWKEKKIEDEPNEKKLTYCTYTKFNEGAINIDLPDGKVYSGRTSGYNKYPNILIAQRDLYHHKTDQGYDVACYDDHEYSRTNSRFSRHADDAYKIIRGREQVIIDALGGSWSDNGYILPNTRSGNNINGIGKVSNYDRYVEYTLMSMAKLIPPVPPSTWNGACILNN